ncbi:MAG TPA: thiamine pyrophosphate-dependent enzyme [Terracidiphilus sp.]|nr:thiamine pyrophosphate-dependent enzyme [Terracidiphilus sp.]
MVNTLNSTIRDSAKDEPLQENWSLISNEKLLDLYALMVKCQMLEQRATGLLQQGEPASDFCCSAGREASAAAVAIDLTPGDTLSVPPGDWLPAFAKGMSPESLFLALASGTVSAREALTAAEAERNNVLLAGDQPQQRKFVLERAVDARAQKDGAVVAVFITSAPAALDGWRKVMTSAAAETLPIILVHHTDGAAISAPSPSRRGRNPEAFLHGVPAISVDATDPVAIYRVAFEAILRARQNRGATLLECTAVTTWSVDPVSAMHDYLRRKAIDPSRHERQIVEGFQRDLDLATRFLER